jgi:hypothetical protein
MLWSIKSKNFLNLNEYFSLVAGDLIVYRYKAHGSDLVSINTLFFLTLLLEGPPKRLISLPYY